MLRLLFLAAGIVLFAFLVIRLGPEAVLEMLGRIGWDALAIAGIYVAYQSLRALALSRSVTGDRRVSWREALWIRFSGEAVQFLTFTGPFLAEPAKAWLLKGRGLSAAEGFAATIAEFLVYTFAAAAFSIVAIGLLLADGVLAGAPRGVAIGLLVGMSVFLAAALLAIVTRTHLLGAILERLAGLPGLRRRLRPDMAAVHHVEDLLLGVLRDRPGLLARVALMECGSLALHMLELYAILRALDLHAGLHTAFLVEGSTKFIGLAFFFVPGQVGASEGAHTIVFELVGLPAVAGFTVPFIRRIRSIVVAGVGLLAMSLLTRGRSAAR
jgi:hypothetical protein